MAAPLVQKIIDRLGPANPGNDVQNVDYASTWTILKNLLMGAVGISMTGTIARSTHRIEKSNGQIYRSPKSVHYDHIGQI